MKLDKNDQSDSTADNVKVGTDKPLGLADILRQIMSAMQKAVGKQLQATTKTVNTAKSGTVAQPKIIQTQAKKWDGKQDVTTLQREDFRKLRFRFSSGIIPTLDQLEQWQEYTEALINAVEEKGIAGDISESELLWFCEKALNSKRTKLLLKIALAVWEGEDKRTKLHSLLDQLKEDGGKDMIIDILLMRFTDYVSLGSMYGYHTSLESHSFGREAKTEYLIRMGKLKRDIFNWIMGEKNWKDFRNNGHVMVFFLKYEAKTDGDKDEILKDMEMMRYFEGLGIIRTTSYDRSVRHHAAAALDRNVAEIEDGTTLGTIGKWGLDKNARIVAVKKLFKKKYKNELDQIHNGDSQRPEYNDQEIQSMAKECSRKLEQER